eukprot:6882388-Prymnesium_polylepis.1
MSRPARKMKPSGRHPSDVLPSSGSCAGCARDVTHHLHASSRCTARCAASALLRCFRAAQRSPDLSLPALRLWLLCCFAARVHFRSCGVVWCSMRSHSWSIIVSSVSGSSSIRSRPWCDKPSARALSLSCQSRPQSLL